MPTIAPSQSSLRVMPAAPAVDPGLFTQVPNPAAGMQMFEQAAKLPLMFEQIKMEKMKMKAEKAKLDLAELQANYQQQNFEKLAQQQQALAGLEAQAKQSEIFKNTAQAQQALAESSLVPVGSAPAPAPLAEAVVASAVAPAQALAPDAAPIAAPAAAPAPAVEPNTAKLISTLPVIPEGVDKRAVYDQLAQQEMDKRLKTQFGQAVPLKTYRANVVEAKAKLAEELRPKEGFYEYISASGIPMRVKATMIGSKPVELLEDPVADLEAFYKRQPQWKEIDSIVSKEVGPMLTGGADRKLESNLKNLNYAKQILQDSSLATGSFVSMLPDAVRSRIPGLQQGISARDAVRNVVQQTLRETLGAQFARIEGEMMMERAFDPRMPEAENIRRINLLANEVIAYATSKQAAADYLKQNGTMFGYTGDMNFEAMADKLKANFDTGVAATPGASGSPADPFAALKQGAINSYLQKKTPTPRG